MRIHVVGIRHVSYTSKRTGLPVEGDELHFTFPDRNTRGVAVDKVYISAGSDIRLPPFTPCDGDIFFNRYGKVDFATWEENK